MRIEPAKKDRGVALLIVLFMISFLLAFVTANSNALNGLKREVKLVDQKQKAHWENLASKTNKAPSQTSLQPNP